MPAPTPPFDPSPLIRRVTPGPRLKHSGGDMWPITWLADDSLLTAAGDNDPGEGPGTGHEGHVHWSPLNTWRVTGTPGRDLRLQLIDNLPFPPDVWCRGEGVDRANGIKPASLLALGERVYFAIENINYGDNPAFNRQRNLNAWIVTSDDAGRTWKKDATPADFFTGRLSSPHFIQAGRAYSGAPDPAHVYALFPAGRDGRSYWCNADHLLLGRVPADRILDRSAWRFFAGLSASSAPAWSANPDTARPVFDYPGFTGENHVAWCPGLRRYLLGNYAFHDPATGLPRPYHQIPWRDYRSQLTLFEAEHPWGPWRLFHRDDTWGNGDYQPCLPTKWMSPDGRDLVLVSAGNDDDYRFVTQSLRLDLA